MASGRKTNYGKKYMGIVRNRFVIDEAGKIAGVRYDVKADKSLSEAAKSADRM